jgi:hypothetical protein
MEIKLCANCFAMNSLDCHLLDDRSHKLFEVSYEWETSISQYFGNFIFSFNYEFFQCEKEILKTIVFNPYSRKTYIIDTNQLSSFIEKNFPKSKLIERQPIFFSFLIPFPSIIHYEDNDAIKNDDQFNISLGKFKYQTYKNIENYTLRINPSVSKDFRENDLEPIFQKDFKSIYNLIEDYKTYLNLLLDIDTEKVKINNLVSPFFLLEKNEILELVKIEDSIYKEMYEEMERYDEERRDREYDRYWNSTLDELNREAFENDPDNYWNID